MQPAGWVQALMESAAVVAAAGVLISGGVKAWRVMRRSWAAAVAHEVDPKIKAVQASVDALREDGERRFDTIDAKLGTPNGKGNVVAMLEKVLDEVRSHGRRLEALEQRQAWDRLGADGSIERRGSDDVEGET